MIHIDRVSMPLHAPPSRALGTEADFYYGTFNAQHTVQTSKLGIFGRNWKVWCCLLHFACPWSAWFA